METGFAENFFRQGCQTIMRVYIRKMAKGGNVILLNCLLLDYYERTRARRQRLLSGLSGRLCRLVGITADNAWEYKVMDGVAYAIVNPLLCV